MNQDVRTNKYKFLVEFESKEVVDWAGMLFGFIESAFFIRIKGSYASVRPVEK